MNEKFLYLHHRYGWFSTDSLSNIIPTIREVQVKIGIIDNIKADHVLIEDERGTFILLGIKADKLVVIANRNASSMTLIYKYNKLYLSRTAYRAAHDVKYVAILTYDDVKRYLLKRISRFISNLPNLPLNTKILVFGDRTIAQYRYKTVNIEWKAKSFNLYNNDTISKRLKYAYIDNVSLKMVDTRVVLSTRVLFTNPLTTQYVLCAVNNEYKFEDYIEDHSDRIVKPLLPKSINKLFAFLFDEIEFFYDSALILGVHKISKNIKLIFANNKDILSTVDKSVITNLLYHPDKLFRINDLFE